MSKEIWNLIPAKRQAMYLSQCPGHPTRVFRWLALASVLSSAGCSAAATDNPSLALEATDFSQAESAVVQDYRVGIVASRLSLAEQAGQMVQGEVLNILSDIAGGYNPVTELNLGSILSGGDGLPKDNSPTGWSELYDQMQRYAIASSSHIPVLYGIDAVHGHNAVLGSTIFPHNVGVGASRNPILASEAATITAREVAATGLDWTFAPCLAVTRDDRWGRTYESYGEAPQLQELLVSPVVLGLQGTTMQGTRVVATAKHFIGDGGTQWGTGYPKPTTPGSTNAEVRQIDRGNVQMDLDSLKQIHGKGYVEAVRAGVGTVMVSFSSVNGVKMSAYGDLILNYLKGHPSKGGLGFAGFVVSDWNAVEELPIDGVQDPLALYKEQVILAINAGIDLLMVEGKIGNQYKYALAHQFIQEAVRDGKISRDRINDAVARILRIKAQAGLFEKFDSAGHPKPSVKRLRENLAADFGSAPHRDVARQAVRESLVLLKNDAETLPLRAAKYDTIYVAGKNAHNLGAQCGGWTHGWQGQDGNAAKTPADHTILEGIEALGRKNNMRVVYSESADFPPDPQAASHRRGVVVAVIGEHPYAEFFGDSNDLSLDAADRATLGKLYKLKLPVVTVMVSARPAIVTDELRNWHAFVAAWLPGTQGEGVADVLAGDYDFSGKLPITWPRSMSQIPINVGDGQHGLFEYGSGLRYEVPSGEQSAMQ